MQLKTELVAPKRPADRLQESRQKILKKQQEL